MFCDNGTSRHNTLITDLCTIHNNGTHTDHTFITDCTAMDDGTVSDCCIMTDDYGIIRHTGMNHDKILYIGA